MRALPALIVLLSLAGTARADDERPITLDAPATCTTVDGRTGALPAGTLVPAPAWARLDAGIKDRDARIAALAAENASLRASAGVVDVRAVLIAAGAALVAGTLVGVVASGPLQRGRVAPAP